MKYIPGVVNKLDWYWWLISFGVVVPTRMGRMVNPICCSFDLGR